MVENASQAADTSKKVSRTTGSGARIVSRVAQDIDKARSEAQEFKGNMPSLGRQAEGIG